jgi:CheY-like chemotaxis protein
MERIKILVIDDDARFTRVMKSALERTGEYEVWEENEGTNALHLARETKPDLIFLDVQMPTTTGAFVARCVRNEPDLQDIPIVYITAIVPKDDSTAGRDLGGLPFIAKPVALRELLDCIDRNIPAEKRVARTRVPE